MTRDAGYTLVEMLAALAVIGLAFGGLAAGSHILLRQQRGATSDVATSESLASAQAALERALAGVKRGDVVVADARRIEIVCNVGNRCDATDADETAPLFTARSGPGRVGVVSAPGYRFAYWTTAGAALLWVGGGRDDLTAITLTADKARATPIAVLRLREEQAFRCEYDVVIASCREPAP